MPRRRTRWSSPWARRHTPKGSGATRRRSSRRLRRTESGRWETTGKPVMLVVVAGRPLGLGPAEQADAILMAYQGSTEAGQAVADVMFGKVDPSGKLPVTWPSDAPDT